MKDKVNFLVRFLALTVTLFLIWIPLGKVYLVLLSWVSKCVLWVVGYHATLVTDGTPFFICRGYMIGMDEYAHLVNYNIVPLVALILATPGIEIERRVKMLAIGLFLLFGTHVIDLASHVPMYCGGSGIAEVVVIFMAVIKVAVPFVIWFVLARKEILGSAQ